MTVATGIVRAADFGTTEITPRRGTLLDAAHVTDGIGFLEPQGLFESLNCITTDTNPVWPCPAADLAAPVQAAATNSTTTGTLAAGTYRSKITALNARGETIASNEISTVTTGSTSKLTYNWAAVTGATGYRVYRTAVNGATNTEVLLATVGAVTSYVDDGSGTLGSTVPPTVNTAVVQAVKNFQPVPWQSGFRFAAYGGVICKPLGTDIADLEARLRAAFEANESIAVERALITQRMVVNGTVWAAAPDLTPTPGTPVKPQIALAILEADAAKKYAGVPTIHMGRGLGTLLAHLGALDVSGDIFYTKQGSKVASDGGYDDPSTGPTGAATTGTQQWMWASGEVSVARGDLFVHTEMDRPNNDLYVLAERPYVAAVDCYTAGVLTDLTV